MAPIVGLSGGLASGKSTACEMFARQGAAILDADVLHRRLHAPGSPHLARIAEAFGPEALDASGGLDLEALGRITRGDPGAAARLGEMMHTPWIGEMMRGAAAARDAGASLVVLAIPMLFDGLHRGGPLTGLMRFDATVCVWAPREVQLARLLARDGSTRAEAERRIDRQLPNDLQRALADYTIDNAGPPEATERQVAALYRDLVAGRARGAGRRFP